MLPRPVRLVLTQARTSWVSQRNTVSWTACLSDAAGGSKLRPAVSIPDESVSGWGLFLGSGVKASAGKSACAWRVRARLDSAGYKAPGTFRLCARFCPKVETLPSASDSLRRSCDIIGLLIVDGGCSAIHPIYNTGASTSVRNPHSKTEGTCESWSPTTTA